MPKAKYGRAHQLERERWARHLAKHGAVDCHAIDCLAPTRTILDGEEWDLGHNPSGSAWTGPEHPTCNRSEGASRGNKARGETEVRRWVL